LLGRYNFEEGRGERVMISFNCFEKNGCCLICSNRICNNGEWCSVCLCKECKWYEYIPEVEKGCCFHPSRDYNPQFDAILEELGLRKRGRKSNVYKIWKERGYIWRKK